MTDGNSSHGLSAREQECLSLAAQGLSAKEISRAIGSITDQTVETYLKRACRKLGVSRSVAGARLVEALADARPHKWDVPPEAVAPAEENPMMAPSQLIDGGYPTAAVTLREQHEAYSTAAERWPAAKWLPFRREGGQDNELSFNAICGWTIGLPLVGAALLLIVAVAVAAVGLIWGGSINHHPN